MKAGCISDAYKSVQSTNLHDIVNSTSDVGLLDEPGTNEAIRVLNSTRFVQRFELQGRLRGTHDLE